MKKIILGILHLMGYDIVKIYRKVGQKELKNRLLRLYNLGYDYESEAHHEIKKVASNTMVTYPRLVSLYEQVVFCEKNNIEGVFVECGVWKGGAIGLMALGNLKHGKVRRHLHLLDAFQEICEPDEKNDSAEIIKQVALTLKDKKTKFTGKLSPLKGVYDTYGGPASLSDCWHLIEDTIGYDKTFVHYHVGWFQETVPIVSQKIDKIAILRLDGDWYASTKVCLEHLYDKVATNGFIVIDDYNYNEGCKKAIHEFLEKRNENVFLNFVDRECRYWIKSQK